MSFPRILGHPGVLISIWVKYLLCHSRECGNLYFLEIFFTKDNIIFTPNRSKMNIKKPFRKLNGFFYHKSCSL